MEMDLLTLTCVRVIRESFFNNPRIPLPTNSVLRLRLIRTYTCKLAEVSRTFHIDGIDKETLSWI